MAKTDQEIIEKYRARIKRQNETIKESYDRISATLPKGTIDRIKALGFTVNFVVNQSVLAFLECEEEMRETEDPQNVQEAAGYESADKLPARHPERPETTKTDTRTEAEQWAELQAILDAKKAEIEAAKQEQEANKEQKRAETIAAAKFAEKSK